MADQRDAGEPVSRTYVSKGLRLHYADWGNDGAPTLVLLHGVRDHARSWDQVAQALSGDWRVVAPDLRGHGDSAWSPDGAYLASYHLADFVKLTQALGDAPLTIVAHSFGGNVAARFAAAFPERVRKLALLEGLGPAPKVREEWAQQGLVKRTRDFIARQAAPPRERRMASLEEAAARQKASNPRLSDAQALHLATHGARRMEDGYAWKFDPLVTVYPPEDFTADERSVWSEIMAPTLLCWGAHSWTTNPALDGRAAFIRDHRVAVFEHAGHWMHHEQFDDVMRTLRDFL